MRKTGQSSTLCSFNIFYVKYQNIKYKHIETLFKIAKSVTLCQHAKGGVKQNNY